MGARVGPDAKQSMPDQQAHGRCIGCGQPLWQLASCERGSVPAVAAEKTTSQRTESRQRLPCWRQHCMPAAKVSRTLRGGSGSPQVMLALCKAFIVRSAREMLRSLSAVQACLVVQMALLAGMTSPTASCCLRL